MPVGAKSYIKECQKSSNLNDAVHFQGGVFFLQAGEFSIEILQPDHVDLLDFRQSIYSEDLGLPAELTAVPLSHSDCQSRYPDSNWEEVYKFGDLKWRKVKFDGVAVARNPTGKIVSISGFRRYEKFVRVGMHLYTLKAHRNHCRSMLWRRNGFIDATLLHLESSEFQGMFISIYPHNRALKKWVERLARQKNYAQLACTAPGVSDRMSQFYPIEKPVLFNGVPQKIFFAKHSKKEMSLHNLEEDLVSTLTRPGQ